VTRRPERPADSAGLLFGLGAYGMWGLFPAFFVLLEPARPTVILAHRILWTLVFMAIVLVVVGRLGDLARIRARTWLLLATASALISLNWFIYIYAVASGRVVDAALGYFINPLVSVVLGMALFGERLNRAQLAAVAMAVGAVALLSSDVGGTPVIALALAVSFGLYGSVKKVVRADPRVSVGVETAIAAPFAAVYLIGLQVSGVDTLTGEGPGHGALLMLSGPLTALPLLFFAAAAQRLPLVTIGLLQYLTPSMQMVYGLVVGGEEMSAARWTGFALIWLALAVFSVDALSRAFRSRRGACANHDDEQTTPHLGRTAGSHRHHGDRDPDERGADVAEDQPGGGGRPVDDGGTGADDQAAGGAAGGERVRHHPGSVPEAG